MKKHLLHDLLTLVTGILALTCLVLAVLSAIPGKSAPLKVQETIDVSSSQILANSNRYSTRLSGLLKNPHDDTVTVTSLTVRISDGKTEEDIRLDCFSLKPRHNLPISELWESEHRFDRVLSVTAEVNGEQIELKNATAFANVNGLTVILAVLALICGLAAFHFGKISYYIRQEERAS